MDFLIFSFFWIFYFFIFLICKGLSKRVRGAPRSMGNALAAGAAYVLGAAGMRALTLGLAASRACTCLPVTALAERMVIDWPWGAHSRSIFRCDLRREWLALGLCDSRLYSQSARLAC
jgi:hypothetical protein